MPVRIYTKIDGFTGSDANEGNTRDRVLLLEGENDESRIYTVIDDTTGKSVPALNSAHPVFSGMVLKSRDPNRIRAGLWEIRLRYGGIEAGTPTTPTTALRYRWEIGQTTENRDYDVYDKPLIDRAGFPISNGFPFTNSSLFLKVWRQETDYDVATAMTIMRRTNKVRMSILNRWWVDPGQMMLWTYAPDEDQRIGATSVRTMYLFEFREGLRPFQPKWPNNGLNNYATGSGDGAICYANGDPITTPVNFNINGEIIANTTRAFRIKKRDGNVVAAHGGVGGNASVLAKFSTVSTPNGTHATEPGSDASITYQWSFYNNGWKMMAGTNAETILLSQDFYKETDLRGLIPGIL